MELKFQRRLVFVCGTWSRSVGDVPLCCFWLGICTSLLETPPYIGKQVRPAVGGSLGAQDACQQVLLCKNGGSSPSCFVLESSGLQIELEKEARKAQVSSLLHDGSATQLTKAKAPVAKDRADEFLHEQLSGHPDHFAQRSWVSWQLLLVAAQACQQVTPCPFNTSLSPKAANVHSSINGSPQFVTTADSAILKDAEFVYDGFTVVDQTGLRYNVDLRRGVYDFSGRRHTRTTRVPRRQNGNGTVDKLIADSIRQSIMLTAVARLTATSSARLELGVVTGHCDGVPPGFSCTEALVLVGPQT